MPEARFDVLKYKFLVGHEHCTKLIEKRLAQVRNIWSASCTIYKLLADSRVMSVIYMKILKAASGT